MPFTGYIIRRVVDAYLTTVRPLNLSTPLRELELAAYGRNQLTEKFFKQKCLSFPYQLFIDGFGLYRNMYRSLTGIYMIPASLSVADRTQTARGEHVYPITLTPHGSKLSDAIDGSKSLAVLDKGVSVSLNNESQTTLLVGFAMAFLGDMPQQQANAGFKSQNAVLTRLLIMCDIEGTARESGI